MCNALERVTRFELVPIAWKAIVLAINTTPALSESYSNLFRLLSVVISLNFNKNSC